ncbi:MAG: hypothetical protein RLZZ347_849 [Candidatus Parcubacteria bacterium]|jgi:hypothetical protein
MPHRSRTTRASNEAGHSKGFVGATDELGSISFGKRWDAWAAGFDSACDNILTVPQGTPRQIAGQILVKIALVTFSLGLVYLLLVGGLAM